MEPVSAHLGKDAKLFHSLENENSQECLRFWESTQPAVVVGHLGSIDNQVHEQACRDDDVPIVRRLSGGGAVLLDRGCLNYSMYLSLDDRPELFNVEHSYRLILGRIVECLRVRSLAIRGTSDLAIDEYKISGNSQRRGRRALLHHGTILYDFRVESLDRYLKEPERQPSYREGRKHASFVTNLPLDRDSIKGAIQQAWGQIR